MAHFVLVHGAWLGGWCWKNVRPFVGAPGHELFTPMLKGLGEREHVASPEGDGHHPTGGGGFAPRSRARLITACGLPPEVHVLEGTAPPLYRRITTEIWALAHEGPLVPVLLAQVSG